MRNGSQRFTNAPQRSKTVPFWYWGPQSQTSVKPSQQEKGWGLEHMIYFRE
jgi:hypothetical protein